MLELLLSKQFAEIALLLLGVLGVIGMLRIHAATSQMAALIREFSQWQPSASDENSFLQYKGSVQNFCMRTGNRICGMWLAFLDEVKIHPHGSTAMATCTGDALEKLRENLLFAYGTSNRVARNTGSILAGMGLSCGLGILCAAALKAAPYFSSASAAGKGQLGDQGLAVLIAGGGLALLTASFSLLSSVAANAFERSQLTRAEREVDRLIAIMRMQIPINVRENAGERTSAAAQHTVQLSDHSVGVVANAVAAGFQHFASAESERRALSQEDSANLKKIQSSLQEYIANTALSASTANAVNEIKASSEQSKELRNTVTAALSQFVDLGTAQSKFWESVLLELRSNTESTLSLGKALTHVSQTSQVGQTAQVGQAQQAMTTNSTDLNIPQDLISVISEIKECVGVVTKKIDKLDKGIAQDVDDLLAQAKKSQSILVQTLTERLDSPVAHPVHRAPEPEPVLDKNEFNLGSESKSEIELAALEPKAKSKIKRIRVQPIGRSSSRKKVTEEDVLNIKNLMTETRKGLSRAVERAQESTGADNELTEFCNDAAAAINKLIQLIIEQTEARMSRYGNAYEPLAESNTFVCEILSQALIDIGDFRRQGAPAAEQASRNLLHDLVGRIGNLEEFLPISHQANRLRRPNVNKMEIAWNRAQKAAARHKSWLTPSKSALKQKSRENKIEHFRKLAEDLKSRIAQLQQAIETSVIDQVSHWPSVLDQARQVRESTRLIATTGSRWARASASKNPNIHGGIAQIIQAVEVTEELLLVAAAEKDPTDNSTAAPR
jgi:hypothetical protein